MATVATPQTQNTPRTHRKMNDTGVEDWAMLAEMIAIGRPKTAPTKRPKPGPLPASRRPTTPYTMTVATIPAMANVSTARIFSAVFAVAATLRPSISRLSIIRSMPNVTTGPGRNAGNPVEDVIRCE